MPVTWVLTKTATPINEKGTIIIDTITSKTKKTSHGVVAIEKKQRKFKRGVHVHLFGQNENGEIISALILKRASDNQFSIVSGKSKPGEKIETTAYRETSEETGLIPSLLHDTDRRITIQCRKYTFYASVFVGLIKHNTMIKLNHEHTKYEYVPTDISPYRIEITEQQNNQKFCINKARTMFGSVMS